MANPTPGWIQLTAVVGAIQGLFLAAVLVAQRNNRTANRLLAVLMLEFSIYLAAGPYYTAGFVREYPHFFGVSYHTTWVFGPLVYLYARAASDRSWRFEPTDLVHFIPVAIIVVLGARLFTLSGPEKIALYEQWSIRGITPPLKYVDPSKYVSGVAYSAAVMLLVLRHRRDVEHSYSNIERVHLRWLLWFAAATCGIWLMATSFKVLRVSGSLGDEYITFAMALLVYGIGYMGLRQPEVFRYQTEEHPVPPLAMRSSPAAAQPETVVPRYERSGLSDAEAAELKAALLASMERQQPWKESELTLADLAARLNSTPHKLSEVLNSQIGQTFYDFVNGYRVREVQRRIAAGDARTLKMLALAMDAGFASKSTFNEVFKKHTNQTPSAFRQTAGA